MLKVSIRPRSPPKTPSTVSHASAGVMIEARSAIAHLAVPEIRL